MPVGTLIHIPRGMRDWTAAAMADALEGPLDGEAGWERVAEALP